MLTASSVYVGATGNSGSCCRAKFSGGGSTKGAAWAKTRPKTIAGFCGAAGQIPSISTRLGANRHPKSKQNNEPLFVSYRTHRFVLKMDMEEFEHDELDLDDVEEQEEAGEPRNEPGRFAFGERLTQLSHHTATVDSEQSIARDD